MKKLIIFESILILFFVLTWNVSKAKHSFEIDNIYYKPFDDGILVFEIYNGSESFTPAYENFLYEITFKDGTKRVYEVTGNYCQQYSNCNLYIRGLKTSVEKYGEIISYIEHH